MSKEKLIKDATDTWCLYGQELNKAFGLSNFLIDASALSNILESNSENHISAFIKHIENNIEGLKGAK